MTIDLILGTAGHIDHGKTSLVQALTGTDADRLPEEKRRGITIELGFAALTLGDLRLGIVDVPGHERFVRHMLAGATGIDLAMLVVAADDSVKPQTREHLEILQLLDLQAGVIVLTKCDLADEQWVELVEAEVLELVEPTFLADAELVRTSVTTGAGLDSLRQALAKAASQVAEQAQARQTQGPFRMAIDRAFSASGHGLIVTGSVSHGQAQVGDTLVIEPGGREVRVRGIQNHDSTVDEVHRGQRAAINLAGDLRTPIVRGQELATPGHLQASRLMTVQVRPTPHAKWPTKKRFPVRAHLGTAEIQGTLAMLEEPEPANDSNRLAQLRLATPAVATWQQPLVLRSVSPVATIGGGVVLDPTAMPLRANQTERITMAAQLGDVNLLARASAALYFARLGDWSPHDLARSAGIDEAASVVAELLQQGLLVEVRVSPSRVLRVHAQVLDELGERVMKRLHRLHDESPLQQTFSVARLQANFGRHDSSAILDAVLARLQTADQLALNGVSVAAVGRGPQLSKGEQRLYDQLIETLRQSGVQPPWADELQQTATKNRASVPGLLQLAVANGQLIQVNDQFYLHQEAEQQIRTQLRTALIDGRAMSLSEIRSTLETTRKFAVPLCEYFDRIGFTQRHGDLRVLGEE